jgi:hypothetical protein
VIRPLGTPTHPDGGIQVDGAGGNDSDPLPGGVGPHPHDGAFAQLLLDLGDGQAQGLLALVVEPGNGSVRDSHDSLCCDMVTDFASLSY